MGLNMWGSKSSACDPNPPKGNPNPRRWACLQARQIGGYLVLLVQYPDATNYEGRKIMLLRATLADVCGQAVLDPHFTDKPGVIAPIARFVPTDVGWSMAVGLASMLLACDEDRSDN